MLHPATSRYLPTFGRNPEPEGTPLPIRRNRSPQRVPLRKLSHSAYNPAAVRDALRPHPLPQRIITLRSLFNLSQADMAEMLGVERNTISNWEAGVGNPRRVQPSHKARRALAYVFDLPASLFVDDDAADEEEMATVSAREAQT